jgi:hypothetical protein
MNITQKSVSRPIGIIVAALLLAACDSGPSDAEFVAACLKEGQLGANKAMSRALGIDRDKFCQCGAKAARVAMSENGRRLMVWGMEGNKRQEIAALQAKMSDDEKMKVMGAGLEVFGQCARSG